MDELSRELQLDRKVSRSNSLRRDSFSAPGFFNTKSSLLKIDKTAKRMTCLENTATEVAVNVRVEKVSMTAIHPQNDSYPVFTAHVERLQFEFSMLQDHDLYRIRLGNFRLLDNTNYPNTLDPR